VWQTVQSLYLFIDTKAIWIVYHLTNKELIELSIIGKCSASFFHFPCLNQTEIKKINVGLPYLPFFLLINEPKLGTVINPGMILTQVPSSIRWDLNQRSSNRESSSLTTRLDFRPLNWDQIIIKSHDICTQVS